MIFVREKSMRLLCVFSCLLSKNVLKLSWNLAKSWPWNSTLPCWDPCTLVVHSLFAVTADGEAVSTHTQSRTAPISVDVKRLVSEAEWQLLQREVIGWFYFLLHHSLFICPRIPVISRQSAIWGVDVFVQETQRIISLFLCVKTLTSSEL